MSDSRFYALLALLGLTLAVGWVGLMVGSSVGSSAATAASRALEARDASKATGEAVAGSAEPTKKALESLASDQHRIVDALLPKGDRITLENGCAAQSLKDPATMGPEEPVQILIVCDHPPKVPFYPFFLIRSNGNPPVQPAPKPGSK